MTRRPDPARDAGGAEGTAWSRSSERRNPRRAQSESGSESAERSQTTAQGPKRAAPGLSLKARALACLARREHSRAELQRKLGPYAESEEEIERALDDLAARGFLSDARVVESVLHQRAPRMGTGRLRQELQRKGIPSELSTPALAALSSSEADRAWSLWQGKFGHRMAPRTEGLLPDESECEALPASARRDQRMAERAAAHKEWGRQQRFLLSRGFSASVVNATLRRAAQSAPDAAGACADTAAAELDDPFTD